MKLLLGISILFFSLGNSVSIAQSLTDKQEQEAYEAGIFEARATETLQIKVETDYLTPCETKAYTKYGVRPILLGTSLSVYEEIKSTAFNEVMYQRIKDSLDVDQDVIGKLDSNQVVFDNNDYANFFKAITQEKISDSLVKLQLPTGTLEKLGYPYLKSLKIKHLSSDTWVSISDLEKGVTLNSFNKAYLDFVTDPNEIEHDNLCIDHTFYALLIE
ncbi:hypothetical protein [Lishizhenia sp.]|uniref:hypothetical protein n=1 Tax=Lishizhenia sp. TaxID=2497594 RepID=UPI00299D37F1|nr:hypothetical protein [Lishizhenia sp.]MDX1446734.1 hypothetical protein [Lishizhenia sp.]